MLRWKSVNVRPTKVEICAPVQFHRYTTNYGGPLRASDAMNKGASFQFYTVVLVNVCYRLYAQAEFAGHHDITTWPPHAYHDVFNRALDRGQWFYTSCLGWKESLWSDNSGLTVSEPLITQFGMSSLLVSNPGKAYSS